MRPLFFRAGGGIITMLLCAGCVSMVERTGLVLDGSARAERTQAIYRTHDTNGTGMAGMETKIECYGLELRRMRNRDGELSMVIMPRRFPSVQIRTTAPDAAGGFLLVSLDYLGGNEHGWNEFRLDLFGSGTFTPAETGDGETMARLSVSPGFEPVQISFGRIRRYDTRITGGEALLNLRNRHERIMALTEWMHTRAPPAGMALRDFERHWKPILFPELARQRNRPQAWFLEGDVITRAENVGWNTGYTERVFPELLWNIRNSGTMLRDWEEALEWIHLKHEWPILAAQLSREIVLQRVR